MIGPIVARLMRLYRDEPEPKRIISKIVFSQASDKGLLSKEAFPIADRAVDAERMDAEVFIMRNRK